MGCALFSLLLGMPRLAILLLLWLRQGWLQAAIDGTVWIVLGFLFLPWTTLAFAYGMNELGGLGQMTPLGWLLTTLGVLLDLGIFRGARRRRAKKKE